MPRNGPLRSEPHTSKDFLYNGTEGKTVSRSIRQLCHGGILWEKNMQEIWDTGEEKFSVHQLGEASHSTSTGMWSTHLCHCIFFMRVLLSIVYRHWSEGIVRAYSKGLAHIFFSFSVFRDESRRRFSQPFPAPVLSMLIVVSIQEPPFTVDKKNNKWPSSICETRHDASHS